MNLLFPAAGNPNSPTERVSASDEAASSTGNRPLAAVRDSESRATLALVALRHYLPPERLAEEHVRRSVNLSPSSNARAACGGSSVSRWRSWRPLSRPDGRPRGQSVRVPLSYPRCRTNGSVFTPLRCRSSAASIGGAGCEAGE
jgi:hypothetical protein